MEIFEPVKQRFYANMELISRDIWKSVRPKDRRAENSRKAGLPFRGSCWEIEYFGDTVTIKRALRQGVFAFNVDVQLGCGFQLSLLCTSAQVRQMLDAKKKAETHKIKHTPQTWRFFELPGEVRSMIYDFAVPRRTWYVTDLPSPFDKGNLPMALGDLTGSFFPFGDVGILGVNKQMRREALPIAYRHVEICASSTATLIASILSIGQIGRDNIFGVHLYWREMLDLDPGLGDIAPAVHGTRCLQLLRGCKRLGKLHIDFDDRLFWSLPPEKLLTDPGLQDLLSLRGWGRLQKISVGNIVEYFYPEKLPRLKVLRKAFESDEPLEKLLSHMGGDGGPDGAE